MPPTLPLEDIADLPMENGPKLPTQLTKDGPCEPPLAFRLGPGRTIRGRVVDTNGRSVAGARVSPKS